MKVLLFAGAGTSVELGVPAMVGMGEEFIAHANQWYIEPDLVQRLIGDSHDVEHLIEELDRICSARSSLEVISEGGVQLDRVDKIRAEVEWFVQHVAERVVASDARLMWGGVLRAASITELTIVTTNYDRAIELAANAEEIAIDDGFATFTHEETAAWVGFHQGPNVPRLVKLHGSTDWYADGASGAPTKLRHPMPLFGRASLRLTSGVELGSALVLPSREKLLTHSPYPRLSQVFLNAADSCDLALFIGSSLRDPQTRDAAQAIAQRVLVLLVNLGGDTYGLQNIQAIKQRAGSFLISTLPNALASSDPAAALASDASRLNDDSGVLIAVRQALDTDARSDIRCGALEQLDEMGLTLDQFLLEQLLADRNETVARYALGLVYFSPRRASLIHRAVASPHASVPAFSEDLQLLQSMIGENGNELERS